MLYSQVSTTAAFARALSLVDNDLLDVRASRADVLPAEAFRIRLRELGVRDERAVLRAVNRLSETPSALLDLLASDSLCGWIFELRRGLPTIRQDSLARRLVRLVDPDALACLHPDLKLPIEDRLDWSAVAMADDDGAGLLRAGSTDTHIHLGGTLPPVYYWMALMGGELPLEVLEGLASGLRGHALIADWQRAIARAMWTRLALAWTLQADGSRGSRRRVFLHLPEHDSELWFPFAEGEPEIGHREIADAVLALSACARHRAFEEGRERPFSDPLRSDDMSAYRCHYAEGERRLLTQLTVYLRDRHRRSQSDSLAEERLLDYLRTRNAFHALLCHDVGADGLLRFVESFGRRGFQFGVLRPRRRPGRRQQCYRRLLRRLERTRMHAALDEQLVQAFHECTVPPEPPIPRGIEMRVSVPAGRYFLLTLSAWLNALSDHLLEEPARGSQVGLVFHLIKRGAEDKAQQTGLEAAQRLGAVLLGYPALRHFIVGFDAAGAEWEAPPRVFGQAFNYLRRLQAGQRSRPGEPPLGLGWTYHVGEDVDDIVSGLRHVDEVVAHLLDRGVGRIGHGLVLGQDAERFYSDRGNEVELSKGAHLLDLVWAWGRLTQSGEQEQCHWIKSLVRSQCATRNGELPDVAGCYWAMDLERGPEGSVSGGVDGGEPMRSESELLGTLGFVGDAQESIVLRIDKRWVDLVSTLQRLLRDLLARRRVTVEVNPTSNLIIGGFADYADLPYAPMIESGLPLSINTDDPGLFITSLPNEFAAMYRALVGPMTRREAGQWLEERRLDAERSTFLGPHVPAGWVALRLLDSRSASPFAYRPVGGEF